MPRSGTQRSDNSVTQARAAPHTPTQPHRSVPARHCYTGRTHTCMKDAGCGCVDGNRQNRSTSATWTAWHVLKAVHRSWRVRCVLEASHEAARSGRIFLSEPGSRCCSAACEHIMSSPLVTLAACTASPAPPPTPPAGAHDERHPAGAAAGTAAPAPHACAQAG